MTCFVTKSKTLSPSVLFISFGVSPSVLLFRLVKRRVHRVNRRALPPPLPRALHRGRGLKPRALLLTLPQALRHGNGRGLPLHLTLHIAQ